MARYIRLDPRVVLLSVGEKTKMFVNRLVDGLVALGTSVGDLCLTLGGRGSSDRGSGGWESPSGVQGQSPCRRSGGRSPPEAVS